MDRFITWLKAVPKAKKIQFLLGLSLTAVLSWYQPLVGVALAVGAALGKEWGDKQAPGGVWDWYDIAAALAGSAVALIIVLPIYFIYFY